MLKPNFIKVRQPESSGEHIVLDDAALAARAEKCAEVITSSKEKLEGVDNENIQYLASLKTQFAAQSVRNGFAHVARG